MGEPQLFDLNIEEVLEHWEVEHAIREIIANALDEQLLSGTADVEISEEAGGCRIRDFGRGLGIEHFTLSESEEKLGGPEGVIGKFGVGLKDALATFHRRGIGVRIRSRHGVFALREAAKHNFDEITTLHVQFTPAEGEDFEGTEFALEGVGHQDLKKAKGLFLRFSGEQPIERTAYGEVLRRGTDDARVYISGVLANEESNFLFSYNVTSLTEGMRKRLNRERLNVGRTTYAERVKSILKVAQSETVLEALAKQVAARAQGTQRDEMQWIEVSQKALNVLHMREKVTFMTEAEMAMHPHVLDNMRRDGYQVVVVDDAQKGKLEAQEDGGLRTLEGYVDEYNESFSYAFVEPAELSAAERGVLEQSGAVLALIGTAPGEGPPVLISETMRVGLDATQGVWDSELGAIVIKRSQLSTLQSYAATLLHEAAHARSGAVDATREFESVLTDYLGRTSAAALRQERR
jgi:hypothetical protein